MNDQPSPSLSICMISDDFLPEVTGVAVHLQQIMLQLIKHGHKVCIITSKEPGQEKVESWNGIKIYRCPSIKMFGFYQAYASKSAIKKILTENQVDIVHLHYLSFLFIRAFNVAQAMDIKCIYTYHMTVDVLTQPLMMKPYRPLISRMIVHYCNKFEKILVPSQKLAEDIKSSGINAPAYFINNPVTYEPTDIVKIPRDNIDFLVLYAGRLSPEKNIPFLINAFFLISKIKPQSHLWIAGHGNMRSTLEKQINNLGITNSVKFFGHVPHEELAGYYNACDVFVLPSLIETQGMVALEAMRFSKPVIVTSSIVSADELVSQGDNGFIVNPESIDELAERLVELANDPVLCEKMGKNGLERSRQYDPDTVTAALIKHYRTLLQMTVL